MKIGKSDLNLFPLNKLGDRVLDGYFMDADGNVYSTRASKLPKMMRGSRVDSKVYYTCSYYNGRFSTRYDGAKLFERAKRNKSFVLHTSGGPFSGTATQPQAPNQFEIGLAAKGWMIASVIAKKVSIVGNEIYLTPDLTHAALVKAAQEKPGVKFVSLKIDRTVVANGLVWN